MKTDDAVLHRRTGKQHVITIVCSRCKVSALINGDICVANCVLVCKLHAHGQCGTYNLFNVVSNVSFSGNVSHHSNIVLTGETLYSSQIVGNVHVPATVQCVVLVTERLQ